MQQEPMQQQPSEQQPMEGTQPQAGMQKQEECPAFVRGAELKVSETEDGVVFSITTPQKQNIPMLRELVTDVANTVETQSKQVAQQQATQEMSAGEQQVIAVDATTKNIERGVQVTVRPDDETQLERLRKQAHGIERAWQASPCVTGTAVGSMEEPEPTEG